MANRVSTKVTLSESALAALEQIVSYYDDQDTPEVGRRLISKILGRSGQPGERRSRKRALAGTVSVSRKQGAGKPDGLKVASTGHVFCAGPGGVHVYHRDDGACLGVIRTPAFCSNITWGDDDLLSFYLTSSEHLYRTRVKVAGTL